MNLASIIEEHPADAPAIISRGRTTTYGALRTQVGELRSGLAAQGIGPGDPVVLAIGNQRHFVVAYLAVLGLGGVAVPLHPTSPRPELASQATAVGAVAAVVGHTAEPAWRQLQRADVPSLRFTVFCEPEEPVGGADAEPWPMWSVSSIAERAFHTVEVHDAQAHEVAALLFTSGTAGAPRAAMLTHGNLLANLEQIRRSPDPIVASDVVYGVLPLSHIYGLNVVLAATLAAGATLLLVQRFDPSTFVDSVVDRGVTVVPGAPPLWAALAQQPDVDPQALAGIRRALTGAAKTPVEVVHALRERFGLELAEGYGLTEASPVVTSSAGLPIRPGSVGRAVEGVELRIVDEQGEDVLLGDVGELWVRGPNVFAGYLNDPQATARVIDAQGWLHTGDLGTVDSDGYVYLVDRAKDLIIVSGFNVYPAEVEEVLAGHPAIAACAVVGVAHPYTGEAVKAFVVLEPSMSADEDEVVAWCADRLARYKCPDKVMFVDELPMAPSGKLLRRNLRQAGTP
jgi:long-chain acyl-CoA synthetase